MLFCFSRQLYGGRLVFLTLVSLILDVVSETKKAEPLSTPNYRISLNNIYLSVLYYIFYVRKHRYSLSNLFCSSGGRNTYTILSSLCCK